MSDLPFVDTAQEATEEIKSKARGKLLDWLPTPHECSCGALCTAEVEYVEQQAMTMPIWKCNECSKRYYRESDRDRMTASMWD